MKHDPFRDLEIELEKLRADPAANQGRLVELERFLRERERERRILGIADEPPHIGGPSTPEPAAPPLPATRPTARLVAQTAARGENEPQLPPGHASLSLRITASLRLLASLGAAPGVRLRILGPEKPVRVATPPVLASPPDTQSGGPGEDTGGRSDGDSASTAAELYRKTILMALRAYALLLDAGIAEKDADYLLPAGRVHPALLTTDPRTCRGLLLSLGDPRSPWEERELAVAAAEELRRAGVEEVADLHTDTEARAVTQR